MLATINVARRLGVKTFGALSYWPVAGAHRRALRQDGQGPVKRGKVDAIWLKDAGGLLTVDRIRTLVPAIKKVIGDIPLELHSHCMTGVAPLVYLEGIKAGADCIHSSTAPLANGNAQPSTQSMAQEPARAGLQGQRRRCRCSTRSASTSAGSPSRRASRSACRRSTTPSTTSTRSPAA